MPQLFGTVAADARGKWMIHALPPGQYSVAAAGPGPVRFVVPAEGPVSLELALR
ncbi:MAG: carboxypeptidase-like regulatory domain-containing protein [Planctomycetes bacterium]|nr:carboxypeptidase-like regulatory domain-containing protein [Planctomycetota bacterium]